MIQILVQYLNGRSLATGPLGKEACLVSAATRHYWNCWDLLQVENGVLMRRFVRQDATGDHLQFVVPRSMHSEILQASTYFPTWGTSWSEEN